MVRRAIGSMLTSVCLCATIVAFGPATLDELLSKLPVIEGRVPTFHPAGVRDRAGLMQQLIQDATRYYESRTGTSLIVRLALVGRAETANFNPLRLPGCSPAPHRVRFTLSSSRSAGDMRSTAWSGTWFSRAKPCSASA